ncbi:hypothetical protein A0H81_06533 [Grifola frondosa]|uniref:Uncharacterized protein n=1 Tax=Grifola frondosa TaxID=5627 RepID=A0A1C7MAR1_GRIFR|nr:hypothetical protein A0H81_06533 [Grifola frondosa]
MGVKCRASNHTRSQICDLKKVNSAFHTRLMRMESRSTFNGFCCGSLSVPDPVAILNRSISSSIAKGRVKVKSISTISALRAPR